MKNNNLKYLKITTSLIVFYILFCTSIISNTWSLIISKSYFIPQESSILTFKATKMNNGSGDWWLYGEDNIFYYSLNIKSETPKYFKIKKENTLNFFDPLSSDTWNLK